MSPAGLRFKGLLYWALAALIVWLVFKFASLSAMGVLIVLVGASSAIFLGWLGLTNFGEAKYRKANYDVLRSLGK